MNDKSDDIRARLTLPDGREVWRDGEGRYFDVTSGERVFEPANKIRDAQAAARRHLVRAVRGENQVVETVFDAWGHLVGAQAKIALGGDGTKSTTAAKFVAKATGMMDVEEEEKDHSGLERSFQNDRLAKMLDAIEDVFEDEEEKPR